MLIPWQLDCSDFKCKFLHIHLRETSTDGVSNCSLHCLFLLAATQPGHDCCWLGFKVSEDNIYSVYEFRRWLWAQLMLLQEWRNWEEAEEGGEEDFLILFHYFHWDTRGTNLIGFAWMWLTETLHPVHLHVCLVCRVMSKEVLHPGFKSNSQNTQLLLLGLYEVTVATDTRGVNPASMRFVAERSQSFLPGSLQELPEV